MWNSGIFFQFSFWMFLSDFFPHFKVWDIILVALLVYRYFQRLANICWEYAFICKESDVWCHYKLNKQICCKHLNKKMLLVCKQIFKPFHWFFFSEGEKRQPEIRLCFVVSWLVKCFEHIFKSIQMDSSETANSYPVEDPWSRLWLVWVALNLLYKRLFHRWNTSLILLKLKI